MAPVLLLIVYLVGHLLLFWLRPGHYALLEIGLQLAVLLPVLRSVARGGIPRIPGWLLGAGIGAFVAGGLWTSHALMQGRLYGGDEYSYRFQGSIFASGHVSAPAPAVPVFFEHHIMAGGRWLTMFPPGWPAVLAVASAAGLAPVVNVLLGALTLAIVFRIARRLYSEQEARLALFLMLFSPYFFGNCLGEMSHPLCGLLLAAATLFYFRAAGGGGAWNTAAMLAAGGAATLVRPLTGALFAAILGIALLCQAQHQRLRLAQTAALCGLFGLLTIGANAAYNKAATGDYFWFPYAMIDGGRVPSEVKPEPVAVATNLRWGPMSLWIFGFPLLIPAAVWALWQNREKRGEAVLLAALLLSLVAGYAPNRYSSGSFIGERFYFEAFFVLPLLGARGLAAMAGRHAGGGQRMSLYLGALAAGSMATLVLTLPLMFREAAPYAAVRAVAERTALRDAVVFLEPHEPEFIPKHFNLNTAEWSSAPVFFAPDPGAAGRPEVAQKLGRSVWAVLSYDPSGGAARLSPAAPVTH